MAKIIIGNVKGKDGRGITSIRKTGTTGSVDTYTITYTDDTTSTFNINNADDISLQRQIVPSAAVESSATASQAYAAGDYVVVNRVLRKVKSAIAKGSAISDYNSTATTVTGELANAVSPTVLSNSTMRSGGSVNIPTIADWLVIGVFVSMAGSDNTDQEVMIPCYVGDKFVSGLSGCAVGSVIRLVSVKMLIGGTLLKYDSCAMAYIPSRDNPVGGRNINGVIGLIRR